MVDQYILMIYLGKSGSTPAIPATSVSVLNHARAMHKQVKGLCILLTSRLRMHLSADS